MKGVTDEQPMAVVERVEDGDKEKRRRRRSNRRSKHNSASGVVDEIHGEVPEDSKNGGKAKISPSSMDHLSSKQSGSGMHNLNDHGVTRASNVAFVSMPSMHVYERPELDGTKRMDDQHGFPADFRGRMFSKSCPEPLACGSLPGTFANGEMLGVEASALRRLFAPHWSIDAVNEALEKGEVFKALFHVNAHNRMEAYCKIEGLQIDVLISGMAFQNRAVEGDIVVIKVDPSSLWTKMKGFSNISPQPEDCCMRPEIDELASGGHKGKGKADVHYENGQFRTGVSLEKRLHCNGGSFTGETSHSQDVGQVGSTCVNSHYPTVLDSSHVGSSCGIDGRVNAVENLCATISSFPSKRPTGRVVAIIEKSRRRDAIVGFLNVKQWFFYRECHKDTKKNQSLFSVSDNEYIQLMPNDPKFPNMVVLIRDLPDCIKKRLESGDETVEMELVAAQLDDWSEESPFPRACVMDVLGCGNELQAQINAILYENAIISSEFSHESLSCLPPIPWEVPQEEFQRRTDLRNLCVFTIDPATATDLDDALSIEHLYGGISRVGVHIADVSYFVLPDTALDMEAQIRSTSIYMLRSKLPMLPAVLSEEIGSLNPGVDRLAFSIFWDLNSVGDVIDRWIGRTMIRSCCKLSYDFAQDIIGGVNDMRDPSTLVNGCPQLHGPVEWEDIIRSVKSLHEVSEILKKKRFDDGALQLESSKPVFLFDENGIPYDSMLSCQKDSNFLVEEFMLLANRTAAEILSRAFPDSALLRRHPEPNMRKLKEFEAFCYKHGLELDTSSSGQFHLSLERIREKLKDDSVLIDILISYAAKPMQLASYFCSGNLKDNVTDWGHYALAVPVYTHFTSPLRRYPDIVVHRTLAAAIEAEELYLERRKTSWKENQGQVVKRCFTSIKFDKDAAESVEGREILSTAALKHGVPCTDILADVAAYCNERKLAGRHVKDACDKLYTWVLLKKKEILLSEARVLGLGPRFMSIYIHKLAIERRIYYDDVEGLTVEWLEATSTLVLSLCAHRRSSRKGAPGYDRAINEAACIISPCDLSVESGTKANNTLELNQEIAPEVFPLTIRQLSTIPVALHAVGGDDGPIDIGIRLYISSYLR